MANTKLATDMLAAGFSWDEIKGDAATEYRDMLAAGFTQEETDTDIFDRYGLKFSYDPHNEDDLILIDDALTAPKPEIAQQQLVDADVARISEQEQLAAAKDKAGKDLSQKYPFDAGFTPEQHAQIDEERKNLPFFRRYSDTELANQKLFDLRDSAVVDTSARGPLSWRDRSFQDNLVKQGVLTLPMSKPATPAITATTPAEEQAARQTHTTKEAETMSDYLSYGFRHSTTGLFFAEPPTDTYLPNDPPLLMKAAMGAAQGLGDLPTTIAGGLVGAAATAGTGPGAIGGAFAGAMGMNEAVRSTLLLNYQRGTADSAEELLYRVGQVGLAAGKGILSGYMTGYAGGLAQASSGAILPSITGAVGNTVRASVQPAVEVATMSGANAAAEGRIPTFEDFALNGIMVGGVRMGGFYTSKLAYSFQKTGAHPESLIQFAKQNPAAKEDLLSGNIATLQEAGGNFQPLYLVKRNTPLPGGESSKGDWYYLSQNMAAKSSRDINKKNKVTATDVPEAFGVQSHAIPADTQLLWIKSRSDPNKVRLYKQYMKSVDPEAKFGEMAARDANTLFENPTSAFVEFLQSGKGKIGPKEDMPLTDVRGLRIGDRVMMFDSKSVLSGSVLEAMTKPMEIAATDIQKSVSVNETTSVSKKQMVFDSYQALVDRFQPLNKNVNPGHVTTSYLAARLFMGVDGLVKHWLTVGRTSFARPSVLKEAGFERAVEGKSLKDIFEMGVSKAHITLDSEVSSAMETLGVRIKDANAKSNTQMLEALEQMRQNQEIAPATYEKAKAQLLESTEALTNRTDPLNMFRTYVIARHAQELAAAGIESGLDHASVQAIAKNKALADRFEPAAKELYAYQRALLDYRYRAGLMNKKTYDKLVLQYPEYIPLQRVIEEDTRASATGTYGIKGSSRDIIDPFESIIRQTQFTIREAERNSVLQLIAKEFGESASRRSSSTATVGTLPGFRAIEAEERGASAQRSITYRVAGREKKVSVPADVWRTAKYLDPVSANAFNGLVKAASGIAGVLRAGAIMHPNFGARNFFRDQFSAAINSDSGYKLFYDFGRGLAAVTSPSTGKPMFPKAQEYYAEWLRHGGSNANLVSQDRAFTQDMIQTLLKTNNVQNSVPFNLRAIDGVRHYINPINWGKAGYKALQVLSETSEDGTRLGEYIRAREQGVNPMEAAYRSREVTMDFARMGANMKALNAMSVFLNARVQGADRSIRQLRAHPERTINRIIAGIVLPSMLLSLVQQDIIHNDPSSPTAQALQEIPDWQKNTFWIVPSPVGIFRIPVPQEYGVPFANPARSFIEYMYQNDPDKNFLHKLYDEDYFGAVGEQYFLNWNTLVSSMTPSAVQPLSEVIANYSLFTGTPITAPIMENQLPESRYNRNTTELAKSLSRKLSGINPLLDSNITQRLISPPAIDYLVAGYGGSLGRDLWSFLDMVAQKSGIVDEVKAPAKTIEDLPLIGAFMVKYPNAGSKSLNEFFNKAERFEQTLASIKALMKEGTATATQRAEHLLMETDYGRLTNIRGAIANLSRGIRTIHLAEDIPPEDKRRMIDSMYLDMITFAKGGLEVIKAVEKTNREMRKEQ